jgi:hypothetical protein
MSFTKALACFAALVYADPVMDAVRVRMNSDLVRTVFHSGDSHILDLFDAILVPSHSELGLEDMVTAVIPVDEILPENYHFDLDFSEGSADSKKHLKLSFDGNNLQIVGDGQYKNQEFIFHAPVSKFNLDVALKSKSDEKKAAEHMMTPAAKAFSVLLGEVTIEPEFQSSDELKLALKENAEKAVIAAYESIFDGNYAALAKIPMESFLPMLLLKQFSTLANNFDIADNHLDFGFDPDIFVKKGKLNLLSKKHLLREIESEFSVPEEEELPFAFQMIVDENAVNMFLLDFVLYEQGFSMRELMRKDAKTRPYLQ